MKRREFLWAASSSMACAGLGGTAAAEPATRPNVLWITCEDINPHLGCYGEPLARTPNLDALAGQGARFTNAYSVSGVCAPSRSCIITGMYPTTIGTQHMRCDNPPAPPVRCFTEYLREAGYYCTNNVKTDYQFPPPETAWDQCSNKAHWRSRDPRQPFFSVFNFTISHESKIGTPPEEMEREMAILPPEQRVDPRAVTLPPYYPDTPIIRKHWAHYLDLIAIVDYEASRLLEQLEEDGLSDDTIVFFYGDNGAGLPRAKRWMYDSGIRVPLLIRWPGVLSAGTVTDRLVSFLDFAPTVLSVAGLDAPAHMQGRAFLGNQEQPPRTHIFAARDRMDERYDIIRAVRDARYKYIRNYEPYRPYAQHLAYPEGYPVMQEMRRIEREGTLEGPQTLFFRDTKPVEELYDTEVDPHELDNLVESTGHAEILNKLRKIHLDWMIETEDLAFVPEVELDEWRLPGGRKTHRKPTKTYAPLYSPAGQHTHCGRPVNDWIVELNSDVPLVRLRGIKVLGELVPDSTALLVEALSDEEPAVAYWAAIGLGYGGDVSSSVMEALIAALEHSSITIRLGAAHALCHLGHEQRAFPFLLEALRHENGYVRLHAVLSLDELGPRATPMREAIQGVLNDESKYVGRQALHALGTLDGTGEST